MTWRRTVPLMLIMLLVTAGQSRAQEEEVQVMSLRQVRARGAMNMRVRTEGVVTCVEQHHFFLQDPTGAMKVQLWNAGSVVTTGDRIQLLAVLVGYGSGLQGRAEKVTKIGTQDLPEPQMTTVEVLLHGGAASQRVRMTGSVHDVAVVENEVRLEFRTGLDAITLCWRRPPADGPATLPAELLDAVVEVTGVAEAAVSPGGSATCQRVALASPDHLRVIKAGGADVFARPFRTLASLREKPQPYPERVRVIGIVTFSSDVGWFYLLDNTSTARARKQRFGELPSGRRRKTQANPTLTPGDQIEMVGAVQPNRTEKSMPYLMQCEWRILKHAPPPPNVPTTSAAILSGDYDGKAVSLTGAVVDIKVEKNFQGVFNHKLTIDDDGISFEALLQKETKQILPVKIGDFVRLDGVIMAFENAEGRTENFRLNLNGTSDMRLASPPWRMRHFVPWILGAVAVVLAAVVWILMLRTQVRRQTARLRQANAELSRFKAIADTTSDFVGMCEMDGTPLYTNLAGRTLLGIGPDEPVNCLAFDSIYTPEAMELFEREGLAHALDKGPWSAEIKMRHRDGREIPVSFVGFVIKSPEGRPLHMGCMARDISSRHELEKQLRESLAQERELHQLKSGFVNTISHEFRTPLGIILFASSMLRRFDARFGPEERAQQMNAIDAAVARMNDLVEQSLSLGRAEAASPKKQPLDVTTFNRRVIDEVLSSSSHRSPISMAGDENLPPAFSDESMLHAILVNLLSNAVKYSPAGSPVILHLSRDQDKALFKVRDHGAGLREDDLPHLFTSFHRGINTAGIPGTGLGLAIVKRCAQALGGNVLARNAAEGGAEFIVELPAFFSHP